jgi:hypothetical protein
MSARMPWLSRRTRRWLNAAIVSLLAAAVFGAYSELRRQRARALASEIQKAGGRVHLPLSLLDNLRNWGSQDWKWDTRVMLGGSEIDGRWLRNHDYLDHLSITELFLNQSLSASDVVRLMEEHPIKALVALEQSGSDQIAAALAGSDLKDVDFLDADLTDAGLRQLPLEHLHNLNITGTKVTPPGLAELRRCQQITWIGLDGNQLDESVIAVLAELPSLESLTLVGPGVTDRQLAMLPKVQRLQFLYMQRTSVTQAGLSELDRALPECVVSTEPPV